MKTDLAIDLGTENTLIQASGPSPRAWNEPSLIAYNSLGRPMAAGHAALCMEGRTHDSIRVVRPLIDGVIVETQAAVDMLQLLLKPRLRSRPGRVLISFPHAITAIEKRAFHELGQSLGPRQVVLVKEPLAAAVGSGWDVLRSRGQMIVDLGKGIIEAVVMAQGEVVAASSMRLQGRAENDRLGLHLREAHGLSVGAARLEALKRRLHALQADDRVEIKGLAQAERLPKRLELSVEELLSALDGHSLALAGCILQALEQAPLELLGDVMDQGIFLTGGGSLSQHVVRKVERHLQCRLHRVAEPLRAVALGNRLILDNPPLQQKLSALTL